jgi:hypothetical protein
MWNLPSSKYVKEFEPKLNSYNNNNISNNSNTMMMLKKERSYTEDTQDSSRCDDQDDLPDIVPVSSLASISDSSTMSSTLSPGAGAPISPSPPLPVRSIFKSYWSSPHHHRDGGDGYHGSVMVEDKKKSKEEEVELLHKLALPFVDEGEPSSSLPSSSSSSGSITKTTTTLRKSASAQAAPIKTTALPTIPQRRSSIDDTTIDYSMKNKSRSPITPRRQILPSVAAPPPPLHAAAETAAATLSSVQDQARFNCTATPLRGGSSRTWSSTTSLIKRPTHSCLRPSRYSCSIIDERRLSSLHQELNNDKTATKDEDGRSSEEENEEEATAIEARSQMKRSKSVSFYSEVSVFEFFVCNKLFDNPHGCSSEGWSKYFTA